MFRVEYLPEHMKHGVAYHDSSISYSHSISQSWIYRFVVLNFLWAFFAFLNIPFSAIYSAFSIQSLLFWQYKTRASQHDQLKSVAIVVSVYPTSLGVFLFYYVTYILRLDVVDRPKLLNHQSSNSCYFFLYTGIYVRWQP